MLGTSLGSIADTGTSIHESNGLSMIDAVLFDWDDTLVRTRECKFSAIKAVGERYYARTLSDSDIEPHWGKEFRTLFSALFSSQDSDTDRIVGRYLSLTPEFPMFAHDDALEVVSDCISVLPVGVVTSASRKVVEPDLHRLGFPALQMTSIQCSEDTSHHKPDPRVFDPIMAALELLGVRRERTLYVGDAFNDYAAASAAGLQFCGILRRGATFDPFSRHSIDFVEDLRELRRYLAA